MVAGNSTLKSPEGCGLSDPNAKCGSDPWQGRLFTIENGTKEEVSLIAYLGKVRNTGVAIAPGSAFKEDNATLEEQFKRVKFLKCHCQFQHIHRARH